jgi:hypothetical protein
LLRLLTLALSQFPLSCRLPSRHFLRQRRRMTGGLHRRG